MRTYLLIAIVLLAVVTIALAQQVAPRALAAQTPMARPPITGIAHVQVFVTNTVNARDFYEKSLGLGRKASGCSKQVAACLVVNDHQQIQLLAAPLPVPADLVAEIAFATPDVERMRGYLISKGLAPNAVSTGANHVKRLSVVDPEGHVIAFVEPSTATTPSKPAGQLSTKLIHAGFIVRDRQAEDRFYKDILGFHLYWQGGMKDDQPNWVSMQVPEGTDWVEYMLNVSPSASHRVVGIMNHIALGVIDIQATRQQLLKNGGKAGEEPQEPKIGRDGKWQLNLYDPDETRIEFMEFKPVQKPCCSDFGGPHPQP